MGYSLRMAAGWFEELKERRVFRALVGYGVVSFAILQVVEPVMPAGSPQRPEDGGP